MLSKKEFPIFKTKKSNVTKKFDLSSVQDRQKYFQAKAGQEISKIKNFLDSGHTFIAYLLGKKNSGKGTYTKMFTEIFGQDKIKHISAGDIVRDVHKQAENSETKLKLKKYITENYRGFLSPQDCIDAILNRSQKTVSIPDDLILLLLKREIDKYQGKTLFIDGFPRTLDQISTALYFKELINYRKDPDFFVAIDIPESVIDARMKTRVVCPKCQVPRNTRLFPTKYIGYDKDKKEFYLMCDNFECNKAIMVQKEGDDKGIESIRKRLDNDQGLIQKILGLYGIQKILLRNALPAQNAFEYVDDYEITPEYYYEITSEEKIIIKEKPWVAKDDQGDKVYSLLPAPVVLGLISQLAEKLK